MRAIFRRLPSFIILVSELIPSLISLVTATGVSFNFGMYI